MTASYYTLYEVIVAPPLAAYATTLIQIKLRRVVVVPVALTGDVILSGIVLTVSVPAGLDRSPHP